MNAHPNDFDPHRLAHEIETTGEDYADKKHAADLLVKTEKSVLATLTCDIRKEHPDISRKEAEDMALASTEFKDHIYAMADAVRAAAISKAHYEAARAKLEAMRTAEATKRFQSNLR